MPHKQIAEQVSQTTGYRISYQGEAKITEHLSASRWMLDNGLKILFLADHGAPIFTYQTWFKVGSCQEKKGKTGMAHLLEHLMFKGTTKHPEGEFDREMERRGAQTNAATFVDWTYYIETLPAVADNLNVVVTYESDRMRNLALTPAMLASEREVVKNERRQSVDNSISGKAEECLLEQTFLTHPYGHPVIGYMEDINTITLDDLQAFYHSFYVPNRAAIVLVGNLDIVETLCFLAKAYGPIPVSSHIHASIPTESPMLNIRRKELFLPTETERMSLVFHAPEQTHPDHLALQVLADILSGGETGTLYRDAVIEQECCQEVRMSVTPFSFPGCFQIDFTMQPNQQAAPMEALFWKHLRALQENQVHPNVLERVKNRIEASFFKGLLEIEGKAEQIGHFETTTGDASFISQWIDAVRLLSAEKIQQVALKYFSPTAYSMLTVHPG